MASEGDGTEVSSSGSVAQDSSVSSGERGVAIGGDVNIQQSERPSTDSGTPIALVAIVALVLVVILVIFLTLAFLLPRPGESTLASLPINTLPLTLPSISSTTHTPDPRLSDALHLIGVANRYICHELTGRRQETASEGTWCQQSSFEELFADIGQTGKQRAVFFTYHESPVVGQANCLWLWGKYVKGIEMEEVDGYQVCAVERWAYVPEDPEERVIALVSVSMCYLDVVDEELCIRICKSLPIWYKDDLTARQWDYVNTDEVWPTPVPPTR